MSCYFIIGFVLRRSPIFFVLNGSVWVFESVDFVCRYTLKNNGVQLQKKYKIKNAREIHSDKNNNLYIFSGFGIYKYNHTKDDFIQVAENNGPVLNKVFCDSKNRFWGNVGNNGIFLFSNGSFTKKEFPKLTYVDNHFSSEWIDTGFNHSIT